MKLDIFQIDAFATDVFSGNPAAVVPLYEWLSDETLQKIANENNLAETAFFVRNKEYYELRWFTPEMEVDLCGHATLATAFVLFHFLDAPDECVVFETKMRTKSTRVCGSSCKYRKHCYLIFFHTI